MRGDTAGARDEAPDEAMALEENEKGAAAKRAGGVATGLRSQAPAGHRAREEEAT